MIFPSPDEKDIGKPRPRHSLCKYMLSYVSPNPWWLTFPILFLQCDIKQQDIICLLLLNMSFSMEVIYACELFSFDMCSVTLRYSNAQACCRPEHSYALVRLSTGGPPFFPCRLTQRRPSRFTASYCAIEYLILGCCSSDSAGLAEISLEHAEEILPYCARQLKMSCTEKIL